ncbi:hypothetical protein [Streptomyces sp. NPDC001568]|uniref:hypothetical protein n=1 Tax=Streptomyces sp. NPDC001568 TaxID=3364588 RepID=UPI00369D3374
MLNPIDVDTVIRDGGASGRFPEEIHSGVAWWIASCFVVVTRATQLVVAHDGHETSSEFFDRLCRGAINARHYACRVFDHGIATEDELLAAMAAQDGIPGIRVKTDAQDNGAQVVTITLYAKDGSPIKDRSGLVLIRRMISEDQVPIPVNEHARGTIEPYPGVMWR